MIAKLKVIVKKCTCCNFIVCNKNKVNFFIIFFLILTGHKDDSFGSPQLRGRSRTRKRPPLEQQRQVIGSPLPSPTPSQSTSQDPLYRTTSLETRSRTPSPNLTTPTLSHHEYYGSANLTDRSRSPSPPLGNKKSTKKHGRRLPSTPQKPSTLNLNKKKDNNNMPHVVPSPTVPQPHKSPGSINFPRLNMSPTHGPKKMNVASNKNSDRTSGAPARPQPVSPTEESQYSVPSRESSNSQIATRRPGSWEHIERNNPDRNPSPRYTAQILNNGQRDPHYKEKDNRYLERERRLSREADGTTVVNPRIRAPPPNMPNGFKPRQRAEGRTRKKWQTQRNSDSDDDEDWC